MLLLRLLPLMLSLAFTTNAATVLPGLNTIETSALSNLTSTQQQTQSEDTAFKMAFCTKMPRWSVPALKLEDCMGVLDYFYLETMDTKGSGWREFRAPGAKKISHATPVETPRKYTFGTCTLAIVMLSDFPNAFTLPGGYKTGQPADTATYSNVWKTAENVVEVCVQGRGEVGWQATGAHIAIGVFIWSTGSAEDKLIEADEPRRFTFPLSEGAANGSAASA